MRGWCGTGVMWVGWRRPGFWPCDRPASGMRNWWRRGSSCRWWSWRSATTSSLTWAIASLSNTASPDSRASASPGNTRSGRPTAGGGSPAPGPRWCWWTAKRGRSGGVGPQFGRMRSPNSSPPSPRFNPGALPAVSPAIPPEIPSPPPVSNGRSTGRRAFERQFDSWWRVPTRSPCPRVWS